jgi:choline-sulfatase
MNVLLIMSDEHRRDAMGHTGHPVVKTPNLDKLASVGTRFESAYCSSPLCGPSRASFVTGRPVNENQCWDQEHHYDGSMPSWGQYLASNGVHVTTIGKLDFREGVSGGFDDQRLAQHRKKKKAPEPGASNPVKVSFGVQQLEQAGPGDFWVSRIDAETGEAVRFLQEEAPGIDKPWVLWLNYLPPHFPLVAPPRCYEMYPLETIDMPYDSPSSDRHPVTEELRRHQQMGTPSEHSIRNAKAAYYGLCTYIDEQIGMVVEALERSGLVDDTLIIYTSDHGDHLGDHDLWWKSSLYEQAAGIPLLMAGHDISSRTVQDPVSLLDVTATIADAVGLEPLPEWKGVSLLSQCRNHRLSEDLEERAVLSEYHAHGVAHSMYMIRKESYKYIYHPAGEPQLFDLKTDPRELNNLAAAAAYQAKLQELHQELLLQVNPDEIDRLVIQTCKM